MKRDPRQRGSAFNNPPCPEDPTHGHLYSWTGAPGRSWFCPNQRCTQRFFGMDDVKIDPRQPAGA